MLGKASPQNAGLRGPAGLPRESPRPVGSRDLAPAGTQSFTHPTTQGGSWDFKRARSDPLADRVSPKRQAVTLWTRHRGSHTGSWSRPPRTLQASATVGPSLQPSTSQHLAPSNTQYWRPQAQQPSCGRDVCPYPPPADRLSDESSSPQQPWTASSHQHRRWVGTQGPAPADPGARVNPPAGRLQDPDMAGAWPCPRAAQADLETSLTHQWVDTGPRIAAGHCVPG